MNNNVLLHGATYLSLKNLHLINGSTKNVRNNNEYKNNNLYLSENVFNVQQCGGGCSILGNTIVDMENVNL